MTPHSRLDGTFVELPPGPRAPRAPLPGERGVEMKRSPELACGGAQSAVDRRGRHRLWHRTQGWREAE
jgi:hypothetical protein